MKLLICPDKRPGLDCLADRIPLAQIPVMGQSLVEYWLTYLAGNGCKEATFLVNHASDGLKALIADGARWGMQLEIIPESRELTPAEALIKYDKIVSEDPESLIVLDHFPGQNHCLFESSAALYSGIRAWLPHCHMPDRVGYTELVPGVWTGLHSRISPLAEIVAPCWLGKGVLVGPGAHIGPGTIIEDGSFIEAGAEISESYVGPHTLVGKGTVIANSLAWGSTLLNWKSGSIAEVPDAFILCALRRPQAAPGKTWLERVAQLCAPEKEEGLFIKDLFINKESSS